ncbi:L,D-transpeptidase family protein [Legionella israelensis]|nr:L,D-transpeptidase family protein [Legionella israelensis]
MRQVIALLLLIHQIVSYGMAPKVNWEKAIDKAVERYGQEAESRLKNYFSKVSIDYPAEDIALLAFKSEKVIELWAKDKNHSWTRIHKYPLTAFSGHSGPKLKENDKQIPEGIYKLVSFNPFSSMHLSLMINYPNYFDKMKGRQDRRRKLGNNIFIHGSHYSVGCLAIGNKAIEQLFTLTRRVGLDHVQVIIAPNDLRYQKPITPHYGQPNWLPELYAQIKTALKPFRVQKVKKKV